MATSCPLSYRLGAAALRRAPTFRAPTVLYAVGGLYGNLEALAAIRARAATEPCGEAVIVFNGDFNFFNAEPRWWSELNAQIRRDHVATAGNVEIESSAVEPSGLGCGCGYPAYVSPGVSERSDRIVESLRSTAARADAPELLDWLRSLPRALVAEVGASRRRVGIVHGDVDSLAGWQLGVEAMDPADNALRASLGCDGTGMGGAEHLLPTTPQSKVVSWCEDADVAGLLCTHTCLPFGQLLLGASSGREQSGPPQSPQPPNQSQQYALGVFNNGSGGMPNFAASRFGLATRVSDDPTPPADSLYGGVAGGLRYDAIPIRYDHAAWLERFGAVWPEGSDAHTSYFARLQHGPTGFKLRHAARAGTDGMC